MIKISNAEVHGWEAAIRGMRNPMNSWDKSDSRICCGGYVPAETTTCKSCARYDGVLCANNNLERFMVIGDNDLKLMQSLVKVGSDHSKFMRMITVTVDLTAPLYWWKEFDTYKVGTVRNSCSTMHKVTEKEFTLDDFSHEHIEALDNISCDTLGYTDCPVIDNWTMLKVIVEVLNYNREKFLETKDKKYWWQIIQLLPSSYNQKATVQLNYAVLRNMYHSRKNHKLDEWVEFCKWVETLPYAKELICYE
jgi:hypothetical protein